LGHRCRLFPPENRHLDDKFDHDRPYPFAPIRRISGTQTWYARSKNVVLFGRPTLLTDGKVRAAKPRDKSYKLTDTNRLFLLVTPSGGKLWRWNYTHDGRQKTMAFGAYPLVSLADGQREGSAISVRPSRSIGFSAWRRVVSVSRGNPC